MRHAGFDLDGLWITILWRPTFQDIRNVDILPSQSDRGQEFAQKLAGSPDERPTLLILMKARRFSHKQDLGVRAPFAENKMSPTAGQTAFLAIFDLFVELLEGNHEADFSNAV